MRLRCGFDDYLVLNTVSADRLRYLLRKIPEFIDVDIASALEGLADLIKGAYRPFGLCTVVVYVPQNASYLVKGIVPYAAAEAEMVALFLRVEDNELTVSRHIEVNLDHIRAVLKSYFVSRHGITGYVASGNPTVSRYDDFFFAIVDKIHFSVSFPLIFSVRMRLLRY